MFKKLKPIIDPCDYMPIDMIGVKVSYKNNIVFKNLNISLEGNQIVAIMGKNGSGKSTFIKTLFGIIKPIEGTIKYNNESLLPRKIISGVSQNNIFLRRNLDDNLRHITRISQATTFDEQHISHLLKFFGLSNLKKYSARNLSAGEKQKLAIIRALIFKPSFIFLDEPSNNLDKQSIEKIEEVIKNIHENGTKVFIITHSKKQSKKLKAQEIFIESGAVLY